MQFSIEYDTECGSATYAGDEGQSLTTMLKLATIAGREHGLIASTDIITDHEHIVFDQYGTEFYINYETGDLIGRDGSVNLDNVRKA